MRGCMYVCMYNCVGDGLGVCCVVIVVTRSVVYLETLSCSLSLAEVTGRGYQREGFSGFQRAITVTERAFARSVDCECPISAATSDSLRSSSVRAIALRLGNSLPYTDASRILVPRPVRVVA